MIKVPFLNRKQRGKNVLDVFYKQNLKVVSQPTKIENTKNEHCSDLLFVNTIPNTNQYENIPVVKDAEIDNVVCNVKDESKNEKLLDKINNQSCNENIINQKQLNKIIVEVDNKKLFTNSNVEYENMPLEIVKDKQASIQFTDKGKKRNGKQIKNNIFKKFKA